MIKHYFETIDSTNNLAQKLTKIKLTNFTIIANEQTLRRRQFERKLFPHEHTGLYLTVALKNKADLNNSLITKAAGVAVCRAIKNLYGLDIDIKHMNDLFLDGKTVGAINVETVKSSIIKKYFQLFGIGLNLYKPINESSNQLSKTAGYLFDTKINKYKLADEIIKQIQIVSKDFNSNKIKEEYEKRKAEE